MDGSIKHHGFGPHFDNDSAILILGSFPSIVSRQRGFYYMHPRNRFWQVLSLVYDDDFLNPDLSVKRRLLTKHHIALYDVIESCRTKGSLDNSLTQIKPTDIKSILKQTSIKKIYTNGRKAEKLFSLYFPELVPLSVYLPSTSPTNARFNIDDLYHHWLVIKSSGP